MQAERLTSPDQLGTSWNSCGWPVRNGHPRAHCNYSLKIRFPLCSTQQLPRRFKLCDFVLQLATQLADKHLKNARALLGSQEPNEIYSALNLLDAALDLCPGWDKALELKARAFLYLGKFRDVANMLQEYIPSLSLREIVPSESPPVSKEMLREQMKLLPSYEENDRWRASVLLRSFSVSKLKKKYLAVLSRRCEREEWRYLILGQACCHLGMMEDALVLLQSGKRAAVAAIRRESMTLNDDSFCSDNSSSELEIVNHLLGNIKFLLRRKTAAMAALDVGLYSESARHFSKIIDGRRGTPQGFIAECYMLRATAYQAAGRVTDSIVDCNRTLALDPTCIEALTTRASLFETASCFSESLQDLEHVRLLYETILCQQKFPGPVWKHQNLNYRDVHGNLQILNSKILTMKQRLTSPYTVDYYTLIGLKRGCTRADVERAHMLLCLRHTPDKASQFVERYEFVDERDIDTVKYQARMSTLMLYKLLQKAYTYIMTSIMEEEAEKKKKLRANEVKQEEPDGQVARVQCLQVRGEPSVDIKVEINPSDYCPESEASNIRGTSSGPDINVVNGELQQFFLATSSATDWTLMNTTSREAHVPRMSDTSEFSIYTSAKEDSRLQEMADTSVFQAVSCRDSVAIGTMLSRGFPSDRWMNAHQGHAIRSLPVTYEALSC